MNKSTFSEQCYYTFGDLAAALQTCSLKQEVLLGAQQGGS